MWNFLLDYVTISVNGLSLDSLISQLNKSNIALKNISRKSRTRLRITIPAGNYKRFTAIADNLGLTYVVTRKNGAGHSMMKALGRPIVVIGVIIIILIVVYANSFVISVKYDIDADEETKAELIEYCTDLGIYKGAYKRSWDIDNMELDIYLNVANISFVSIKDTGSSIEIEAVEETQLKEDRTRSDMANVYAIKSCMISRITLYNGECLVEVGDVVKKGQMLVSGNVSINNDTGMMTAGADADIIGRVWYTSSSEKATYDIVKVRNGKYKRNIIIKFGDKEIFKTKRNLDNFECEYTEHVFFDGIVPIKIVEEHQYGVDDERIEISLENAKYIAQAQAIDSAGINIDENAKIINTSVNTIVDGDIVTAQATIETNELISKRVLQE